jgi:hypothetical protein
MDQISIFLNELHELIKLRKATSYGTENLLLLPRIGAYVLGMVCYKAL